MVEIKDATICISGYECGPGVSKVIFSLSRSVESVKKEGALISTANADRTITDIYLSDSKGNQVTGNSTYVTICIGLVYFLEANCSLLIFNFSKFHNEWATEYVIKSSFHVICDGKDALLTFEKDCMNNRFSPDGELFNKRGEFSGRYHNPITKEEDLLTLQYAAYEPDHLKNDNAKNPLIIWIHGQGEGGTDVDIAILGNKVTSLAKSQIQSYFTTENGSKGAYVLAIQCPTYWMDGGDGQNSNGDLVSRFTDILKDTIDDYLKQNEDADKNRIYIGGCSNGGYMSMNLAITYPNFFAATYQTCEAYAYMVFQRDEKGVYIREPNNKSPTAVRQTDKRWFTDEKMELVKELPMWLIAAADDDTVLPHLFSLPTYKQLLKIGAKNVWFSFFRNVEGDDIKGMRYNGHWSWIPLFNDKVTRVQNPEKIVNSDDNVNFGFVPNNDGGGTLNAHDDKGTYNSIFAWLNAQVKKH